MRLLVLIGVVVMASSGSAAAAPPRFLGFEGSEFDAVDLVAASAELRGARSGGGFTRGAVLTLAVRCARIPEIRLALAPPRGRRVRVGRDGHFSLARKRAGARLRLRGRFISAGYVRLVYEARRGRCVTSARVALYRAGVPPFSGCRSQRAERVLRAPHGRVFEQYQFDVSEFFPHVYACLFESDRRVLLGRNHDDETVDLPRLAGPFVGYARSFCGIGGCQAQIRVVDLRDGSELRDPGAAPGPPAGPNLATDIELKENGSVAWIVGRSEWFKPGSLTHELWVSDSQGLRRLDAGALEPKSLALSGSSLSWRHGSQTLTATLD
jgi:hypothetical protein